MTQYIITETDDNRVTGVHYASDVFDQQLIFEDLIREFGIEPHEELTNSRIFKSEDGYTIQMFDIEGE